MFSLFQLLLRFYFIAASIKKKTTESWEYLHCRPELLLFVLYSVCQTLRQREACRCRQQLCLCLLITTLSGLNHWSPPVLSPFCYVLSNSLLLPQRCLLLPCGPQLVPDNLPLFSGAFCLFSNISPPLKPEQLWLSFFLKSASLCFFFLPSSSGSRFRYLSVFLWWNIFGWVPLFCTCDFIFGGFILFRFFLHHFSPWRWMCCIFIGFKGALMIHWPCLLFILHSCIKHNNMPHMAEDVHVYILLPVHHISYPVFEWEKNKTVTNTTVQLC